MTDCLPGCPQSAISKVLGFSCFFALSPPGDYQGRRRLFAAVRACFAALLFQNSEHRSPSPRNAPCIPPSGLEALAYGPLSMQLLPHTAAY